MKTFDPSSVECYYHIWYICPCNKWCHLTSILQILRKAKPRKKRTTMYLIVVSTLKFHKDDDVDPADAGSACWGWTTKRWRELSWMHLWARATLVIYNLLVPIVISTYLSFHYIVLSCLSAIMLYSLVQNELSYNLLVKELIVHWLLFRWWCVHYLKKRRYVSNKTWKKYGV